MEETPITHEIEITLSEPHILYRIYGVTDKLSRIAKDLDAREKSELQLRNGYRDDDVVKEEILKAIVDISLLTDPYMEESTHVDNNIYWKLIFPEYWMVSHLPLLRRAIEDYIVFYSLTQMLELMSNSNAAYYRSRAEEAYDKIKIHISARTPRMVRRRAQLL